MISQAIRGASFVPTARMAVPQPFVAAPTNAASSLPASIEPSSFATTVRHECQDWAREGKKLGSLAMASVITDVIPLQLALHLPTVSAVVALPLGIIGSLIAASLEEHYIGVGKSLGALCGGTAGIAAGVVEGAWRKVCPPAPRPQKIQLDKRVPTARGPREGLAPALLHAVERRTLGCVPARDQIVDITESTITMLSTLAVAYALPAYMSAAVGGPVGAAMSTLAGPVTGMIVGGAIENVLGIGRATGELLGQAISKSVGGNDSTPSGAVTRSQSSGGVLQNAFLALNHIIAEPITGYLIDGCLTLNKLFGETPVQTMNFVDRPSPTVNRTRLLANFQKLAAVNGESGNEGDVSQEVGRQLDSLGIAYNRKADNTIIATVSASIHDAPTVVLSAHLDTVAPTSPQSQRVDDRRIFTDESHVLGGDDRAGLAEILEGVQRILETGADHPEIKLIFNVDEEGGLRGASRLGADEVSTRPALGFVVDALDPRDLNLTNDAVILNSKSVKYQFSQEDPVVQVAMHAMADAGLRARPMHVPIMAGAASDANTAAFNNTRIHSIAVGAGERDIHTTLENIKMDDLEQAARHVMGYITSSCDLKVDGDDIVPRSPVK